MFSGYSADVWRSTTLKPGSIVYGGVPGQSAYYTDLATVKASRLNQRSLFESLQVAPNAVNPFSYCLRQAVLPALLGPSKRSLVVARRVAILVSFEESHGWLCFGAHRSR